MREWGKNCAGNLSVYDTIFFIRTMAVCYCCLCLSAHIFPGNAKMNRIQRVIHRSGVYIHGNLFGFYLFQHNAANLWNNLWKIFSTSTSICYPDLDTDTSASTLTRALLGVRVRPVIAWNILKIDTETVDTNIAPLLEMMQLLLSVVCSFGFFPQFLTSTQQRTVDEHRKEITHSIIPD